MVRPIGNVSVTFDHRVVDGARAGAFCVDVIGRHPDGRPYTEPPGWVTGTRSGSPSGSASRPALRSPGCSQACGSGSRTTLLGAIGVGIVAGLLVKGWIGAGGGVVGGVIGAVSAAAIVRGANRRGATIGGTAFLLVGAAIVVGLLALIPVVGYVEAVVLPVLAARRARSGPEKYAGLRSLAK